MEEKIKEIVQEAIKEEEYFTIFYTRLAEKATDPQLKEELIRLSDFEKMHKERLEKLNFFKVNPENANKITNLDVSKDLGLPKIDEFLNMESMFEFAIQQEINAQKKYSQLAEIIEDQETKQTFITLAQEEKGHEQLLKDKLSKLN
jgi:rubrerythrin